VKEKFENGPRYVMSQSDLANGAHSSEVIKYSQIMSEGVQDTCKLKLRTELLKIAEFVYNESKDLGKTAATLLLM